MKEVKGRLERLETQAPNSLQHARSILGASLSEVSQALDSLERKYYNGKKPREQLGHWARSICKLMKLADIKWLSEPLHLERLAQKALVLEQADIAEQLTGVREIYDRTWRFATTELENLQLIKQLEAIHKFLILYCPAMYKPANDPFVQMARDFEKNQSNWTEDTKKYISHVKTLHSRFSKGVLYLDEMSQSTREMAMKLEAEDCMFVFVFFDACECLREVISAQREWLRFASEYPQFLTNEMGDVQEQKHKLQEMLLIQQDEFNKSRYKHSCLKNEVAAHTQEQIMLESKDLDLLIREELLIGKVREMKLDYDIKEFRLRELQRMGHKTAAAVTIETMDKLAKEVAAEGQELADMTKEMALIKQKMISIHERQAQFNQMVELCTKAEQESNDLRVKYLNTQRELNTKIQTVEFCRHVIQYLTTPDTAQTICLDLPRRKDAGKSSPRHNSQNIHSGTGTRRRTQKRRDSLDIAISFLSDHLGSRWIKVYRGLPFYPPRGTSTVDEDISLLNKDSVRDPQPAEIRKSLERWRRLHTRAKVSDLLHALKLIGEQRLIEQLEKMITPVRPPTPVKESFPSFLDESLKPYYRDVLRYDAIQQAKKIK